MTSITTTSVDTDGNNTDSWIVAIMLLSITGAIGAYFFLIILVASPAREITNVPFHTDPYAGKQ